MKCHVHITFTITEADNPRGARINVGVSRDIAAESLVEATDRVMFQVEKLGTPEGEGGKHA